MNENTTVLANPINPVCQSNPTGPKTFITVDSNTLIAQEFEPLQFAVEKILPHGLLIMAGSGKVGKSWLALGIGRAVATGGKLWDFSSGQGDVLHLALEDNYRRLAECWSRPITF